MSFLFADIKLTTSSPSLDVPCTEGQFRCKNGLCIAASLVCNYQKDCVDGDDERQSCPPPECENGQLSCGQYVFNQTYCYPAHYKCDMNVDCFDGSDESECSKYNDDKRKKSALMSFYVRVFVPIH